MVDYFPRMELKPNPDCPNSWCVKQQHNYAQWLKDHPVVAKEEVKEEVLHQDNEWDILFCLLLIECVYIYLQSEI